MSAPTGAFSPVAFVAKWSKVQLPERAASQEHFLDLCRMLGQPTPAEHDATGSEYAFEKGVAVSGGASRGSKGDHGFADVWWRGKFGWEYKRRGKYNTLEDAYRQLCQYREALESPPLLIVSDIARIEIHTNFTGTAKRVHSIALADIADAANLDLLRRVFTDPQSFKPTITPAKITEEIAEQFGELAASLHRRGHDPHDAAHFLMKCMFCLFAEDVDLLPKELFKRTLAQWHQKPRQLATVLGNLFEAMRTGGAFGPDPIAWFNGGLFEEPPGKPQALELTESEIGVLILAAKQDWSSVEPAIFGTLFERSLDPTKRAQIGAHYTSREDILLVVEPVIMAPLRRKWEAIKLEIEKQLDRRRTATTKATRTKADATISDSLQGFVHDLAKLRILDPACGSGNFLYVAIQQLLALEKEVITYAARPELAIGLLPRVRPTQLHGIEINPYAAELAQVVIWIGYLQWMRDNGFNAPRDPILEAIQTIENRDAILDLSDPTHPTPAKWPASDFIIGNPPFSGRGRKKANLTKAGGAGYVAALNKAFKADLKPGADLCCYWFELALRAIRRLPGVRAGLIATQAIRGGTNREVLTRIAERGEIFFAISDRDWLLDGAVVHTSMIGFHGCKTRKCMLDGIEVAAISADLTTGVDITSALRLDENDVQVNQGINSVGKYEIAFVTAREMLKQPNPTGCNNADVVRPSATSHAVGGRQPAGFIIYFRDTMAEVDASKYAVPFEYVRSNILPYREKSDYAHPSKYPYWLTWNTRGELMKCVDRLPRFLATARHSKYRIFRFLDAHFVPDDSLVAFAVDEDYHFGVLQSTIHVEWATRQGTQVREKESGKRYTPRSSFQTFPYPWPPGKEPVKHPAYQRISDAARELNEQRERWLNPPEWIDPIARQVDAEDTFEDVPEAARPLIRQSAIMARAAKDARLKKRTLTNLYNERPTWLKLAHEKLDRAVLAAYAAVDQAGKWSEDWATVWKEAGAGQPLPAGDPLAAKRAEVDQLVLANLLRMNHERAGS